MLTGSRTFGGPNVVTDESTVESSFDVSLQVDSNSVTPSPCYHDSLKISLLTLLFNVLGIKGIKFTYCK